MLYIQSIACQSHRLISRARARARLCCIHTCEISVGNRNATNICLENFYYFSPLFSIPFFFSFFFFFFTKEQIRNSIKIWLLKIYNKRGVLYTVHQSIVNFATPFTRISTSDAKKLQLREKFCDKKFYANASTSKNFQRHSCNKCVSLYIHTFSIPFLFFPSVSFKKNSYSQRDENFDGGRRLQKTIPSDLKVRAQTVRTVFRREHFKF